jgi:dolichol-phosphate mannosyltransferase
MREAKKLSIVVPVYYNSANLPPLYEDLKEKLISKLNINYELVLVDDGSQDDSWNVMCELAKQDEHIKIFKLARNFGSHAAIMCGLANCTGDCAVVKAADLQEPTELVLEMYEKWKEENNVVLAVREGRDDKSMFSSLYYWLVQKTALPKMPKGGFDIFLLDKIVIEVLKSMNEANSAITGQILWSGFKTAKVYYSRLARKIGKSRWTLRKKIRLVTDTLFSFSTLPIRIVSIVGVLSFFGALVWAIVVLISRIMGNIDVTGWTTLFIFNLFSFGIIMLSLGIMGGYLWRTADAARGRPLYIIECSIENSRSEKEHNEA